MNSLNFNNSILFDSGIYLNSKSCRTSINLTTRRNTLSKKLRRKMRNVSHMETKIKLAVSLTIVVGIIAMLLVG